jgi:hypothetical protein
MTLHLAPIVEGEGEQKCLPRLLHRIWNMAETAERLQVLDPPLGKPRSRIVQKKHLQDYVTGAFLRLHQSAKNDRSARFVVLILIDSEGDCPKDLAPQLINWAKSARSDADIACVLPHPMFETWFAAAAPSLRGFNGLPADLTEPDDPEGQRLGKPWLRKHLARKYSETVDQSQFTARMDITQCRSRSSSFDKLCRELEARLPQSRPGDAAN